MTQKKGSHKEKIAVCWRFTAGNWEFGEDHCWFSCMVYSTITEARGVECDNCGKVF